MPVRATRAAPTPSEPWPFTFRCPFGPSPLAYLIATCWLREAAPRTVVGQDVTVHVEADDTRPDVTLPQRCKLLLKWAWREFGLKCVGYGSADDATTPDPQENDQ